MGSFIMCEKHGVICKKINTSFNISFKIINIIEKK